MNYNWENDRILKIETPCYTLKLSPVPEPSFLYCKKTKRLFGFVAGGDCSMPGRQEETSSCGKWNVEECSEQEEKVLLLRRKDVSTLWEEKTFCIRVTGKALEFYHELKGQGALEDIRFFRLCYQKNEYGFAGNFDEVCTTAPNFREQRYFHPCAKVILSYGNDLSMCSGGHALSSVPHVMGLHDRRDEALVGCGVFAPQGEYDWDELFWNPACVMPPTDYIGDQSLAGGFAVTYYGKKSVTDFYCSPRLTVTFPENVEDLLPCALEYAYSRNYLHRPGKHAEAPEWWREPIYCTWHDQVAYARKGEADYHVPGISPGELCTQELTEEWLQNLIRHNAKPGTVILDDKWQISKLGADPDPAKWQDMRAWIDYCHERSIKVFLWDLAWHNEDIPENEAILRDGKILCGDVTNPQYEERLRKKIHKFFSPDADCLNADGVKIDGLLLLPTGKGLVNHKNIWGLELQKYFLSIVYDEAKKAKKDACISTFAANPYLDEYTDMVRLADMYTYRLDTEDSMRWRTSVYKACHPNVLIDTDGQIHFTISPEYLQ
ncbi:MAG: hypothetical protein J6S58_09735, partial [Lentisphaeria bacterium]|nr:hypothetical protein [Lentisphaeria bacterium]